MRMEKDEPFYIGRLEHLINGVEYYLVRKEKQRISKIVAEVCFKGDYLEVVVKDKDSKRIYCIPLDYKKSEKV